MDEELTALEVFKISEQVQQSARDLYEEASTLFAHHSNLFFDLVLLEDSFGQAIAKRRNEYLRNAERTVIPDDSLYNSVSGLHVFAGADPAKLFESDMRKEEIIEIVLMFGQKVINYFNGLRNFTKDKKALEALDFVLREKQDQLQVMKRWLDR